jgi:hypothetical protein
MLGIEETGLEHAALEMLVETLDFLVGGMLARLVIRHRFPKGGNTQLVGQNLHRGGHVERGEFRISGDGRQQLAQFDFGSGEPVGLVAENQRHGLGARDLHHARCRFARSHHRYRDLTGPRGARDRERGPGQRLIEIRAHACAGEHVARSYGKPFGLGVREALRRHQQELPEAHRLQRPRRRADVPRMRGLAQHDADILERIGSVHCEHAIRVNKRITRASYCGAADDLRRSLEYRI